jgi:hypothetical protein
VGWAGLVRRVPTELSTHEVYGHPPMINFQYFPRSERIPSHLEDAVRVFEG